jgi:extracellular factor (EF) 3-hydroxypalmitic acid methyl ester biosynthesis protein
MIERTRDSTDDAGAVALSEGYVRAVRRLGRFLAKTRDLLDAHDLQSRVDDEQGELHGLSKSVTVPFEQELVDLTAVFEREAAGVSCDIEKHCAFARSELHPHLLHAPFAARTFHKPLGYAGDYEMVNMMLGESHTEPNGCFARFVNDVLLGVPVIQAHRNRVSILERTLGEEATRVNADGRMSSVLSLGCGPAIEIQRMFQSQELRGSIVHLVDFDARTLEHVSDRAKSILEKASHKPLLRLVRQSLEEILLTAPDGMDRRRGVYDLVYCTGLFDYFTDDVCRELTRRCVSWLRPGGLLLTSNVHPKNPHRRCMEHLVDWHLVYRDEEQMRALAPEQTRPRIFTDATGLNVFSSLRVPPR